MRSRPWRFLGLIAGGVLIVALALIAPSLASANAHFSGSLSAGDPSQTGRLHRDGVPDTCAVPGTGQISDGAPHLYDAYEIVNNGGSPSCVEVTVGTTSCTGTSSIYSAAYSPTFNPGNILENWQADLGNSPDVGAPQTYSFTLGAGAHAFINVHQVYTEECPGYTVDVVGADPF
jgi:hypothetical protein